ncbi:OB-fold nucleic acid binding domain-containing protein [Streptomyces sp. NPDC087850]|uniref:OB-fold nucleic acid binding domain-containing protein n=1 Tax=Streptomyces sp. NPDC087850 TaxID=3365809 RepID=UPI0037FCFBB9
MATRTVPAPFTPLSVITAAVTVITARGYYQPTSRQWEKAIPTAIDVTTRLYGGAPHERGDVTRFAKAARATRDVPAQVIAWCREGASAEPGTYRAKLARLAAQAAVTERDVPILASAVAQWQKDQERAVRASQLAVDAERSRHQGEIGERLARCVTVAAVVQQASRTYGYREQARYLVKLRDGEGSVYVWPAQPKDPATLPSRGATVRITATVTKHTTYRDAAQTYVMRLRWKPAAETDAVA